MCKDDRTNIIMLPFRLQIVYFQHFSHVMVITYYKMTRIFCWKYYYKEWHHIMLVNQYRFITESFKTDLWKFDNFSTAETQFLIVIQHSVHVLNPQSINWSIKHVPAEVLITGCTTHTDQGRQDTISPGKLQVCCVVTVSKYLGINFKKWWAKNLC